MFTYMAAIAFYFAHANYDPVNTITQYVKFYKYCVQCETLLYYEFVYFNTKYIYLLLSGCRSSTKCQNILADLICAC